MVVYAAGWVGSIIVFGAYVRGTPLTDVSGIMVGAGLGLMFVWPTVVRSDGR